MSKPKYHLVARAIYELLGISYTGDMTRRLNSSRGFTIVELMIVIVVIGILAAITIISYNGAQRQAREAKVASDIKNAEALLEAAAQRNGGKYPLSAPGYVPPYTTVDSKCEGALGNSVRKRTDWIPGVENLPQSNSQSKGIGGLNGCYMYWSNGDKYIISAWNMLEGPQNKLMYRRLGFREASISDQFYAGWLCNHSYVGGSRTGTYNINDDYYKWSYTVSNIEPKSGTGASNENAPCGEDPPPGG